MKSSARYLSLSILAAALLLTGCATMNTPDLTYGGDDTMTIRTSPLQWQAEHGPYLTTWDKASTYVHELNLGGHNDWRLPTEDELLTLYNVFDYGNAKKTARTKNVEGYYWVAEENGTGYIGAWKDGQICEIKRDFTPGTQGGYVWAVRP